jgi:hypothetical protein
MPVAKVLSRSIKKNRDGDRDVMLLEVEISEPEDRQDAELMPFAGMDFNPPDGCLVFLVESGKAWKIAIAANDGIKPRTNPGELELYSLDEFAGERLATLLFDAEGQLKAQGGGDRAVRFSELKAGFDQLVSDFNAFVTVFNAHTQPVSGATAGAPATSASPSSASVDASEVENFEVP